MSDLTEKLEFVRRVRRRVLLRTRFKWYREQWAATSKYLRAAMDDNLRFQGRVDQLEADLLSESQSVRYYRDKAEEMRQALNRVRSQAEADREEDNRVRYAAQDELDKSRKELERCRRRHEPRR